jgi:hypothetical protein
MRIVPASPVADSAVRSLSASIECSSLPRLCRDPLAATRGALRLLASILATGKVRVTSDRSPKALKHNQESLAAFHRREAPGDLKGWDVSARMASCATN